jgi:bacterioferritin
MASKKLMDMLNEAISRELSVSISYMWQHITVKGINTESVGGVFKKTAITEMKHAETIGERLDYLGGRLTTKPTPIEVGSGAEQMLKINVRLEEDAIDLYKKIIALADKEGDTTTRKLFEQILADEEDHHNIFSTLLGK